MLRIANTKYGAIEGLPSADPRVTAFKGVPFAAPPVGPNRWRAPQPMEGWEGTYLAYGFAPIGIQDNPGLGENIYCREWDVDPDLPMDEDSLYLNIWTPAMTKDDELPVLVWFFGGGFQWGNTREMEFDGERLARRGIIVVTVNYRLASLGFLAHPQITKEQPDHPGNFGHLDQQAGLKWVYENISAFGGDPERITIAGQSAGGASVMAQLACLENAPMIKGAAVFSGMIRDPFHADSLIVPIPLNEAEKLGEEFFEFMGVKTLEEARALDVYYVRDKYGEFVETHPRMSSFIDGQFLTGDPYTLYVEGKSVNVPVLSGNTADEFFTQIDASSEDEYNSKVKEFFGDKADRFIELSEKSDRKNGRLSVIEYTVKAAFMKRANNPSNKPGYYYVFDEDIPGWDKPGSFHSVDLWFFFESINKCWRPFKGHHFELARTMCDYFAEFVKFGTPNGYGIDGNKLPEWGQYRYGEKNQMIFSQGRGTVIEDDDEYVDFVASHFIDKRQCFNPYMPSWEFVPDGEPHVFGDRVYVYGSHDKFNGSVFCMGDYICYSAPVDDLKSWKYEGVIYPKTKDPLNKDGHMCLYAPDVTQGPDGRYYLYYVLDKVSVVSVAVCDEPAGKYKFYGYVHYEDGVRLGEREGDEPQFDPGVLTQGDVTYLYTGFCGQGDKSRHGAMATVVGKDMLTIIEEPKFIVPGSSYSEGTPFYKHAFFEAPSIRKKDGKYYFVYSSEVMHELCYAISDKPTEGFEYGGVIVSNVDIGIDSYKDALKPTAYGANNHGGFVEIKDKWYIFYHRHTNASWLSRQGCAEELNFRPDGSIIQSEITSCGLNGGPLRDTEEYPAYIACNMFDDKNEMYIADSQPRITQDGADGDKVLGYINLIKSSTTIGFKYFDCKSVKGLYIVGDGYCNGYFEVKLKIDGPVLGKIAMSSANIPTRFEGLFDIPDGINSIYLTWNNGDGPRFRSFGFIH